MRGPYWTGAVTPSGKTASCHGGAGAAEAAMGAVFGDLQGAWLGHIEDLSTDGRAVTVGVRQRCAAARTGGGVIDPQHGPGISVTLPASFPCGPAGRPWPAGLAALAIRVRLWVRLFLRRPSLAGGLLLVVLSSAALRSSSAMRSRRVAFSRSSAAFSRTSAVARRNSPWPHSRKALTTVVAKDEGSRRSCRHAKASLMGGEVLVPARQRHGSSASTAIMAASTARRSPAGKAL